MKKLFSLTLVFIAFYAYGQNTFMATHNGIINNYINMELIEELELNTGNNYLARVYSINDEENIFIMFNELVANYNTMDVFQHRGHESFSYRQKNESDTVWGYVLTSIQYAGWMGIRLVELLQDGLGNLAIGSAEIYVVSSSDWMYFYGMAELCSPYSISVSFATLLRN